MEHAKLDSANLHVFSIMLEACIVVLGRHNVGDQCYTCICGYQIELQ